MSISLAMCAVDFSSASMSPEDKAIAERISELKQQLGDDFTAAVELSNEEDIDAALLALDRIVDKGSDGYVTMAKIKKASILIAKGNRNEGLEIYLDLEKNAVDQSFRDIATILFVMNSIDFEPPEELLDKLGP